MYIASLTKPPDVVTIETMTLNTPVSVATMTLNTPVAVETMTLTNTPITVETMTLNTPVAVETMTLNTPITVETMTLNTPVTVDTMTLNTPVAVETMTLNTPVTVETMTLNTPVSEETMNLNTIVSVATMTLNTPVTVETMTLTNTPITVETMTLNTPITVETMTLKTPVSEETMNLNTIVSVATMTLNTPVTVATKTFTTPVIIETLTLNTPGTVVTMKEPLSRRSSTPLPLSSGHPGHRSLRQSASYHLGDPQPSRQERPQPDHLGVPHPGCHGNPQSDRYRDPQPQHRGLCQSASYHHSDRAHHWSSGSESEAEAEPEEEDDTHSGGRSQSECTVYRVVLLGDHGVGKSTLAGIFAGRTDGEESGENTYERTLAVDGQETTLIVMDTWDNDKLEEEDFCMKVGSAYVIVYSITDRSSFDSASELRIQLRRMRQADNIPIILVGNKSDLVRSREVAVEEGRKCAVMFDCKFIETSASLQHNVAELFEGVVRQIRLHRNHADREERGGASGHRRRPHVKRKESVTKKARRFLDRLVARNNQRVAAKVRSKSCHDLAVL